MPKFNVVCSPELSTIDLVPQVLERDDIVVKILERLRSFCLGFVQVDISVPSVNIIDDRKIPLASHPRCVVLARRSHAYKVAKYWDGLRRSMAS